ncbi:hypothetical protein [Larkinella soli]|uniref:hypothetical protein n=1 Tax=Larkinella soli TaxID=1770527 RepID=UPI0013E33238|nr:hypothetical protein [Larkinella soli]
MESRQISEQNLDQVSGEGDVTAPDSETQSSASSSRGTRDTEEHKNPNDPAEGRDDIGE